MRIGILVNARLGSTRLPRKHLLRAAGRSMMGWLLARVGHRFKAEAAAGRAVVVLATSPKPENVDFDMFDGRGCVVFRGADANIPLRHLEAAREFGLDAIVSVDGDSALCSVEAMMRVYDALVDGAVLVGTTGLPLGMNAWGYSRECLERSLRDHMDDALETGWGQIFRFHEKTELPMGWGADNRRLRFTMDYEDDFRFFKAVFESLGERALRADDREVVDLVLRKKLYRINESLANEYWKNFYAGRAREGRAAGIPAHDAK